MKRTLFFIALLFAAAACASATSEKTPRKEIAIQLYSVRSLIGSYGENRQDYTEVLKALAKMGYTGVEAASYADGRFYGKDPETFRKDVEGVGMRVLSSHCSKGLSPEELASGDFSESLKWWDACIAAHKAAGMSYICLLYTSPSPRD